MKNTFFNQNGDLNINESIYNHPSYKRILEDSIVSQEELLGQYDLVLNLFNKIEEVCDEAQKELIKDVIVEMNVLNVISKMYNLQTANEE
jgi:hypothetical protein